MTSRTRPGRTQPADAPEPARMIDPAEAVEAADAGEAGEAADPPVQLTRRERRAAARGGPSQKIAGPAAGRPVAPPARHRDYAARKHG